MSEHLEDFFPIPDWPGYAIDRLGRVRGKAGVLSCDPKGRVRLRNSKGQKWHYVGALMIQAGLLTLPNDAPAATPELSPGFEDELLALRAERDTLERQVDDLRKELTTASETISRGRRLNGHLLYLVRQQEKTAKPKKQRGKDAPNAQMSEARMDDRPLDDLPRFDEALW